MSRRIHILTAALLVLITAIGCAKKGTPLTPNDPSRNLESDGLVDGQAPITEPCVLWNSGQKAPSPKCNQGRGLLREERYFFSRKGLRRSMGTGKIVVEFFSVATSVSV